MQSAFGVDHGNDLVSKAGFKIPGIRMGSPMKMANAASTGYNRGIKQGAGKVSSAWRGTKSAFRSSPGTAAIGGTGAAIGGGLALKGLTNN